MNRSKSNDQGKRKGLSILLLSACLALVLLGISLLTTNYGEGVFNGKQALSDVETQLAFGPRTPGSEAHQQAGDLILVALTDFGWHVEEQTAEVNGYPIRNLIAKRGSGTPWILLGAHYDSRLVANQDESVAAKGNPVPGANDGASGVAILLGLSRSLPPDLPGQTWLVFFDAEDQGNLDGWDWIMGSSYFADHLDGRPDAVVVVDMIGDADLTIYQEGNSDQALTDAIWSVAAEQGYGDQFPPSVKYTMLDDHLPFIERGIPSVLLIDFDYPWWHTSQDTLDKVSAASLDAAGTTLYHWLVNMMGK